MASGGAIDPETDPAGGAAIGTMVRFVSERCPSGVVVELGVGSGRLAVPLLEAGLRVVGLDASLSMLRRCPPAVLRVAADMAHLPFRPARPARPGVGSAGPESYLGVDGPTVLCGFNTLFNLGSAEGLDRLLTSIATLRAVFIVEMMNIELLPDEPIHSTDVAPFGVEGGVVVSSTGADVSQRRLVGRHLEITDGGVVSRPWLLRLVGHDELDARAAQHGLQAVERYRSWKAEPFGATDRNAISVYRPV